MGNLAIDSCSEVSLGKKKKQTSNSRLILTELSLSASWQCSFTSLLVGQALGCLWWLWRGLLVVAPALSPGWMYSPCISTHWAILPSCCVSVQTGLHVACAVKPCLVPGTHGELRFQEWRLPLKITSTAQFHGWKEPEGWQKGLQGALLGLCLVWESSPALHWTVLQSGEKVHTLLVDSGCYFIPAGKGELWPWPSPFVIIIIMK